MTLTFAIMKQGDDDGIILEQTPLYSEGCLVHLKNALEWAESTSAASALSNKSSMKTNAKSRPTAIEAPIRFIDASVSSEDEDNVGERSSGSDSDDLSNSSTCVEDADKIGTDHDLESVVAAADELPKVDGKDIAVAFDNVKITAESKYARTKKAPQKRDEKLRLLQIQRHIDSLICLSFPLRKPENQVLNLPIALLSKTDRRECLTDHHYLCQKFLSLSSALSKGKPVVVLFLRSGRFAGAVFERNVCVAHRTCQHYTVRAGQGKAQSAQDAKGRPKSMGAQLRRAGEENLRLDVRNTLQQWQPWIKEAELILVSYPKTLTKSLFPDPDQDNAVLLKTDARIRRVPLDLGRPSFENVQIIHFVMMTVTLRQRAQSHDGKVEERDVPPRNAIAPASNTMELHNESTLQQANHGSNIADDPPILPLMGLHLAAQQGNVEALLKYIEQHPESVDTVAGEHLMTPLHFAALFAESVGDENGFDSTEDQTRKNNDMAAECVYQLLTIGKSDPTICDNRNRPPYFLATSEKVRNAFRKARAALGEDYCDWKLAKVGPPLTAELVEERKEKEAAKKRKKRARLKEKKAQDKQEADAAEKERLEEEEKQKAKRIRDCLMPKSSCVNACDFCQKQCKGKQRSQMFHRLDYVYCSTECVHNHKRELMASAAQARLAG